MNVLFIGYAVESKKADELTGASVAGNKMQLNIIKNLLKEFDVNSITVWPVAAFPKDKNLYIKELDIKIIDNFETRRIGFLNIPIVKQIWQTLSVYKTAKDFVKKDTIIFTFNSFPQVGLPMMWLKRKYKCRTISMLADLPIDDKSSRRFISKLLRGMFDYLTNIAIESADRIIVLNKNAAEIFAPNKKYIVIEGGIDPIYNLSDKPNSTILAKNIVYSGALTPYSGILNLVEAMKYVEKQGIILEIFGSGELEGIVKEISSKTKNVYFKGKVGNQEMQSIQRGALLLVNPRLIADPISKVTFPSKIFEYMVSGTPVLTTKLSGYSEEYLDKMFVVDSDDSKIIADKINYIMKLPNSDLEELAFNAKKFIMENKTWDTQCDKIIKYIREWD